MNRPGCCRYPGSSAGGSPRTGTWSRAVFYGATKADVKALIKQAQARVDVGAPAKDAKTPLSAVVTAWIASTLEASDLKPSTKVMYATLLLSQVLTDDIASKPLADLKPSHVEQLAVRMRVKGCSPSIVRQTYAVLRSVLETAVRDELLAQQPGSHGQAARCAEDRGAIPRHCRGRFAARGGEGLAVCPPAVPARRHGSAPG
jgi:hypothetical protein